MTQLSNKIRGIIPPLVTPLAGRDELDLAGLTRLVNYQINGGVGGLFMLGTTGEAPSLSYRLRNEVVERTCEIVAGRVPVLVGITDTSLDEAVEFSARSKDMGATAVVAAPPYYFSVGQSEVRDFLLDLADDSALPMFVYNIPPCVKISLTFETVEQLASHGNICGLKDSSGDIAAFKKLLELRSLRPEWSFLIGYEGLTAEATLMGGDGGVTGGANLLPRLFVDIFEAAVRRDQPMIDRLQLEVDRLGSLYTIAGTGASAYLRGLKCALAIAGLCSDELASPFRPAEEPERSRIRELVKSFDLSGISSQMKH